MDLRGFVIATVAFVAGVGGAVTAAGLAWATASPVLDPAVALALTVLSALSGLFSLTLATAQALDYLIRKNPPDG